MFYISTPFSYSKMYVLKESILLIKETNKYEVIEIIEDL